MSRTASRPKARIKSIDAKEMPIDGAALNKRAAILSAAGQIFLEQGFDAATTLDIARMAKISKRTLYEHFASKQAILTAIIASSSERMNAPLEIALPETRRAFFATLRGFGLGFLRELLQPSRIAMYRLAIGEAQRSGSVARELDQSGRGPVMEAAQRLFRHGAEKGFYEASDIDWIVTIYFNVMMGPLQIELLLGKLREAPDEMLKKRVDMAVDIIEKLIGH